MIFKKLQQWILDKKKQKYQKINNIYLKGLKKTRNKLISNLQNQNNNKKLITNEFYSNLEQILIESDFSYSVTSELIDDIKKNIEKQKIKKISETNEIVINSILCFFVNLNKLNSKLKITNNNPSIFLFCGINGSGKTSSACKLGYLLKKKYNKNILLIAADRYRAGGVEQLKILAKKYKLNVFDVPKIKSPASVVYQGIEYADKMKYDIIIIDTSGRLHNNIPLLKELEKISKVCQKKIPNTPNETLLIVDAVNGQIIKEQYQMFSKYVKLTGFLLTKMDSSAKGGAMLELMQDNNLPVKLVSFGEKHNSLQKFKLFYFLYHILNYQE